MIVTLVSQCEKKALKKTRRVLDAFANRIGNRTWQTVITNEGLQAVKKLLRRTASKNTAVSCHWIRTRSRTELVWIVGNRYKFNHQGIVPVNSTKQTIMNTQWENDWQYLPLIKALAALAALFHDWGKASEFFQTKLKESKIIGDPLRHEWISTLFLNAFVGNDNDQEWLSRLVAGDIDEDNIKEVASKQTRTPLAGLPNTASLLAWLIVTHHRLPDKGKEYFGVPASSFQELFNAINQQWGYENRWDEEEFKQNLDRCFDYPKGLPSYSKGWLKQTKKWARKLHDCLHLVEKSIEDGSWRLILHHSRLALMLGDHYYSSCDADPKWQSDLELYANTDRKTGDLKQKLDEHLAGVMANSLKIAHLLPAFEGSETELPRAYDVKALKQRSPKQFRWQDTAVTKITSWRKELPKKQSKKGKE
jgi:CRISPR-associated endonuclease/helicase Cas3